jgi:hypothetical protein
MSFKVGDPVMLKPHNGIANPLQLGHVCGIEVKWAATLLPPQSYVGTIVKERRQNVNGVETKDYLVKWDHLTEYTDDAFYFFAFELRSGS